MLFRSLTTGIVYAVTLFFTNVVFPDAKLDSVGFGSLELSNGLVDENTFGGWHQGVDVVGKLILGILLITVIVIVLKKTLNKSAPREIEGRLEKRSKEVLPKKRPTAPLSEEVKGVRNKEKRTADASE